jgi:hypothetical protein
MWNRLCRHRLKALTLFACVASVVLAAGCRTQEQNPFEAFGPATIPPPNIEVPTGGTYYPSPGAPAAAGTATPPANSLPSISVPSPSTAPVEPRIPRPYSFGSLAPSESSAPAASIAADPADREPIRVVESTPSGGRFPATPQASGTSATVLEAAPAAKEPIRAFTTPPASSGPATTPAAPAFGQPASGARSTSIPQRDPSVAPANYIPPAYVPAFTEPQGAGGQWRPR